MRFAISIPQVVTDGSFDPAGTRAYLAQAEDLGLTVPGPVSRCSARCLC